MTYSPGIASAFNKTANRSTHLSPQSGMCSLCTENCIGTCEIGLAAVLGAKTVYPTTTGTNQVGSEKDYPLDYSHFNINGRVFGALGVEATYEEATIFNVKLERTYGKHHPVKMALPIFLPALVKLNWEDYYAGAAMAGISCVIGEDARTKDPNLVMKDGKVVDFPALENMAHCFNQYDRGYGQIILQCNVEDDMLGVPEVALQKHGIKALEFKFGQSAKGTQPVNRLKSLEEAQAKQAAGLIVKPDPSDPAVIQAYEEGICPNFYKYSRLPLWDETYLTERIEALRQMGLENVYFKMAGYDRADLERVLRMGSRLEVDMITFDGAGGGSGYSPCKMMNEWGYPTIVLEQMVCEIVEELKREEAWIPAITMTGGIVSEDQVFKALAYGNNDVTAIGICRGTMAAAMTGKQIGAMIASGNVPQHLREYGASVEEIFGDLADLRSLYGKVANQFPTGAIGVFSYLNKIAFGLRHFAALNRKFDVCYLDRTDLIPLTHDAKTLL
ncbi:MAG: FMN-binding glutamate synthase family protein [Clostridia bacterium]|nr:FMN-binding glutamate synthase family protein [Clostridia bacterium]